MSFFDLGSNLADLIGSNSHPTWNVTYASPRPSHGECVLHLFPGINLLGRGFQRAGFCVVLGPDLILDARIEDWHGLEGHFDGIIAGPPCQNYSDANRRRDTDEGDRLLREWARVVRECMPAWWLVENVRNVPDIVLPPYCTQRLPITDVECGGVQRRLRHIQFGSLDGSIIRPERTKRGRSVTPRKAVLCRTTSPHDRHCRRAQAQGAQDLSLRTFTRSARARAIGNAVTFPVAYTLAQAVALRSSFTPEDCVCLCGRRVTPPAKHAGASCRKRMERRRAGLGRSLLL